MLRVMVTVLTLFIIASSEISRNEDLLEEYMMYKKFLDKLTPRVSKFHLILKEIWQRLESLLDVSIIMELAMFATTCA